MAKGMILRRGGASGGDLPEFAYTGTYTLLDDGRKNWRIKFLTSGTLTFIKINGSIDVFCVGGGSSGKRTTYSGFKMPGGGGGYTQTVRGIIPQEGVSYSIIIGAGGSRVNSGAGPNQGGNKGGTTSAFNQVSFGGDGDAIASASDTVGGFGGSGGGAIGSNTVNGGNGGSDGSNGQSTSSAAGGTGQGTTTREFGETTGALYAGGGGAYGAFGGDGGGANGGLDGAENTGGGGGGGTSSSVAGAGGSGIVVIRNHREAVA